MKLSEQDASRFFEIMWGLQHFVNSTLKLLPQASSADEYAFLSPQDKFVVREALYEHPELIDRYVALNPQELQRADLDVVASWKQFVLGNFYIERMLKKHAIFIGEGAVYGVLALNDAFDELFDRRQLPVYVRTVLLPFEGRIVYDSLMQGYNLFFGSGISGDLKETYMAAKQNHRIITTLGDDVGSAETLPPDLRDWTPEIDELKAIAKRLRSSNDAPATWSPAFALTRASIELAERTTSDSDDTSAQWDALKKVERAMNRMQTVLYRAD